MFLQGCETYDLKLDKACIFLRDNTKASINGTFHVNLPHKSSFKSIKVRLSGFLKIPRDDYLITSDRKYITSTSEISIGSSKSLNSFQLPAGNYEFPFSIPLEGRILESITGQRHTYHTYQVQAIIERRFRGDSTISRPIRIHRYPYLPNEPQITSIPTTIERESEQEIQYCMSIPDSNISFGSRFALQCHFSPLSKNLALNSITVRVQEKHNIEIDATAAESAVHGIMRILSTRTSTIFKSANNYSHQNSDTVATTTEAQDIPSAEWSLSIPVQLPESFDSASQSVSTNMIKISHQLLMEAEFRNTVTNETVTIKQNIPLSVYMTPAVIGDDGSIHGQNLECFQAYENAPPAYGKHKCDSILAEWAGYLEHPLGAERLPVSSQQRPNNVQPSGCIPITGMPVEEGPPAYQFLST